MQTVYSGNPVKDEGGAGHDVEVTATVGGEGKARFARIGMRLRNESGTTVENVPLSPANAIKLAHRLEEAASAAVHWHGDGNDDDD